ncbi:MAG: hypothetical protein PVF58_15140 [Candidatus Methanofastidiosia archaeon]|jgi:hypothetical protein
MNLYRKEYDYDEIKKQGTGSHDISDDYKIIVCPFDKYEIKMKLSPTNEFIEIVEVKINKEFLSHEQKISSAGFHDVDEFYPD